MQKNQVVIADDALFIRTRLKDLLQRQEFEVVGEATTGIETLEVVRATNPHILLLDITMPKMTGIEILPILKAEYPNLNIIICSALHDEGVIQECLNLGAYAYIKKPYKKDVLIQTLLNCRQ